MTATRHPALQRYSTGQLTAIEWMTRSGERRQTGPVRIEGVMTREGEQVLVYRDPSTPRTDEQGRRCLSVMSAEAIQRRLDADAQAAGDAAQIAPRATDKQVTYALRLIRQRGLHGRRNSDLAQAHPEPTEVELRAMSKTFISGLIDELKIELGIYF